MPDFLNNVSQQITNYWNKFSKKQKAQIIAISSIGIIALITLVFILNKPTMVMIADGLEPAKTQQVVEALTKESIESEARNDATAVYIDVKDKQNAKMVLDKIGVISNAEMTYKEAFNTSLTATESEKKLRYQLAFEDELNRKIENLEQVENADVKIVLPDDSRLVLDESKESKATAMLNVNGTLSQEQIEGIASFLASSVKNLELANVRIIDFTGKLLFDGEASKGLGNNLRSQVDYQLLQEANIKGKVRNILLARGEYNDAEISVNLIIDFNEKSISSEMHTLPEGSTKSLPGSTYHYESEGNNVDASGTPGTDSNDGTTTYPMDSGSESNSSTLIDKIDYKVDTTVTEEVKSIGTINYDDSTLSVTLNKYVYYNEELLEKQGELEEVSWKEYKTSKNNSKIDVDEDIVRLVKSASGLDDVTIIAYEVPMFIDKEPKEINIFDYVPVVVIVLLIILLGYAVYKGTEPVEITEIEPELSVEDMLSTTKERQELEAIEFDEKSETRVQIESFVEDNPEAVAQLLRNWLNDDWE
jgi:flagellar M-ring protein FliF